MSLKLDGNYYVFKKNGVIQSLLPKSWAESREGKLIIKDRYFIDMDNLKEETEMANVFGDMI